MIGVPHRSLLPSLPPPPPLASPGNLERKIMCALQCWLSPLIPYPLSPQRRGGPSSARQGGRGVVYPRGAEMRDSRRLLPESQGTNLALTVLCVPYSLGTLNSHTSTGEVAGARLSAMGAWRGRLHLYSIAPIDLLNCID